MRVACDVGGTFTDLVYYEIDESTGKLRTIGVEKAHTTPPNFEEGAMKTIEQAGISGADIDFFAHGTTVVINALTERKGVKTGLITTAGFRDVLEIGRANRPDFFNLRYAKPKPFVPRHLRQEIIGRMTHAGEIHTPLALNDLSQIIETFKAEGVEAVAICLLHAYANPAHEIAVLEELRRLWPGISAVASHQISREWREYERTSTAVLSAYVQPIAESYLDRLVSRLEDQGFDGRAYIMQSNGGIDTVPSTKAKPITMVESGPASGVLGAAALGELIGEKNLIALDIGGTTAKCSLIDDGRVEVTSQYMIERSRTSAGYPIMTPVVDIVEIGNGGGSIAWVDEDDKMHVGPKSAGAKPGPIAYGQGGDEPTTTDANLMCGRIDPNYFVGGEIVADMKAVSAAFDTLGTKLGLSAEEAARGVIRIANNNMINALKLVSINRGYDPRDFTLVAFGGGGAMHAMALAEELNVPKVIIPANSSVFSAWGMLMSDLRRDYILTRPTPLDAGAPAVLNEVIGELEQQAVTEYGADDIGPEDVRIQRFADMRYEGQEHTVRIALPDGELSAATLEAIISSFHENYEREYTYRLDTGVRIVTFHLVAFGAVKKPGLEKSPIRPKDATNAIKGSREVDFDAHGTHEATVYDRERLRAGMKFSGPAIVEEAGTTTVVFPAQSVTVDEYGNLHIATAAQNSAGEGA